MKRSTKAILIIILAVVGIVAAISFIDAYFYTQSAHVTRDYRVVVTTNSTLENVTLMLPLPSHHGRSEIGEAILAGEAYGIPAGWNCTLAEVDGGVMLRIVAEEIVPVYRNRIMPIPIEPGEEPAETPTFVYATAYSEETPELQSIRFGVSIMDREQEINTRYPLGNESVLSPKRNLTRAEEHPTPGPEGRESTASYYLFECPVYAEYGTDPDTTVAIEIEYGGWNQWWVLGWSGNWFVERCRITLTGPEPGWQYASGSLRAGMGRYR
ncbi:MAG: hypothetical protein KO206_06910 [Methanomicrobiaceae archaeon]|nr:hypothetical protein [Methanomicrobiaceae archaeon]MDD5419641.1 hypothetical protein [Methanomicrobiaceae archaeon]